MPIVSPHLNAQQFSLGDGTAPIDTILTQEANRIGPDIHRRTVHVSPWMDLIKQTAFPAGMGYQLGTLIYDRSLPTTSANGSTLGLTWTELGGNDQGSLQTGNTLDQILVGARDTNIGAQSGKSFIQFARQLKQYSLKRAVVESPRINVEDLRFAAYRQEQLRAIMDALTESTRYSWEERYRDEYDRLCANAFVCKASSTLISSGKEGVATVDLALGGNPTHNISNKILDSLYFRLVRNGAGTNAYGRENARPVFGLVCSSEASYNLIKEAGIRDDYRYNNAKVGELIAPLGIERSHRGFYHLIDDLAPRFVADPDTDGGGSADTADGTLNRVFPYTATNGVITPNPDYEIAPFEAAYVLHQDVMESQIPEPITGANGLTFDPVTYRGKFDWKNIPNEITNPDGTIGFFRGVLASASKPIKTEFGYVVIFKRDAAEVAG